MEKVITIYDIAEKLKLSPSTISRALNDHPAINNKTKTRIAEVADQMGYQTNHFARNLRRQSTMIIGVMVPRLDSYFMANVLAGMEKVANEAGYNLLIAQSLESQEKEMANAETMFNSRVDGLLVSASANTETFAHFDKFFNKNIPTIFFDRVLEYGNAPKVIIDNMKAGYDATKHLIDQGCRRIWTVTGDLKRNVYQERFLGFQKALAEANIEFKEEMLHVNALSSEAIQEIVEHIQQATMKPDGIFVTNDTSACRILVGLQELGYRVPEDIAIVGFNNDPIGQVVQPRLSTVHYPAEELGEVAAKSLIQHLQGQMDIHHTNTIILRHELMVRGSSGRA